ncbi:hypothetical protein AVEN_178966-1 [Araneus ventricosus]|uniref:Uncharacterized protein n=1 Tax=Araneus ventricosus TaxID=182803 RepID=A0A4Y2PYS6_ARAVE|nr:hypothetical protein AVEN_178966-1 [Araneus ventricosus]
MKPRHLNCLAHFGDPPDGSIDVRESVYMYTYKEKIVREHLTGPQHYPDNGLVSGTRGEGSRNQEEEVENIVPSLTNRKNKKDKPLMDHEKRRMKICFLFTLLMCRDLTLYLPH